MKICEDCLQEKSVKDFYAHKKTGPASICKFCTVESNRIRRQDPEQYKIRVQLRRERRRLLLVPDHKSCTKCQENKSLGDFREKSKGLYGRSSWCLKCEGLAQRAYMTENHDEVLARRRKAWAETPRTEEQKAEACRRAMGWYVSNPERAAETRAAYYNDHKAALIAYATAWRKTNPEKVAQYAADWAKANPEKVRANQQRWYIANQDVQRRRRGTYAVSDFSFEEWLTILEMFNHSCAYCLRSDVKLTMDHVQPISKKGQHSCENIVPACKSCNSKKGNRLIFCMLPQHAKSSITA